MSEPVYIAQTFEPDHMESHATRRQWLDERLAEAIKKGGKSMRATVSDDGAGLLLEVWSSVYPPNDQGAPRWNFEQTKGPQQ